MASSSLLTAKPNVAIIRRMSMETYMVRIYLGTLSQESDYVSVEAEKVTTSEEVVRVAMAKLCMSESQDYELAEVLISSGNLCKERRLEEMENPVRIQLLWPRIVNSEFDRSRGLHTGYRFYLRKKDPEDMRRTQTWRDYQDLNRVDNFLVQFLQQTSSTKDYTDLCNLPDLNELTLLENIACRFQKSNIYTYVGSILIAVNPFKFFPIYNPKYVEMYQNKRLGDLPPHIFAIADAAFHTMLRTKKNQCIVISGESGSGKTESTNLLLHHLTALSHKGLHGSGVEQTILGAGPVLEAFGNAKTVHNNNSSRFGKFIQVNYKENGMVHGAIVEKYLLEKSRIVSQAYNERNYHVFYYMLKGADPLEREKLHLGKPEDYFYLKQSSCFHLEEVDEAEEFSRLKQSMELVGFTLVTQKRIFGVLSAVLHLGNVEFKKRADQHHDESVSILNPETLHIISNLLKVKEKVLLEALTQKRATAGDETVVMTHRMEDAVATRDAMAKCLYGALFDWIVLKVNQALLAKRHNSEHQSRRRSSMSFLLYLKGLQSHKGNSIGVLDIFGFEDFTKNSFEQFCINYANEHLQYYFNQHIFKFEQEEYKKEGIQWKNIEFIDNTACLELFSKKTIGLFALLDEECNFPGATNETLLSKFHHHYAKGNVYYEAPQKKEGAFAILHYAGKVKYFVQDFREKNSDQIRTDIVGNLKSSSLAFVRELMGVDPVAVLRWTILKTLIRSMFAFKQAGRRYRDRGGPDPAKVQKRNLTAASPDYLPLPDLGSSHFLRKNKSFKPKTRPNTMFSDIKTLKAIASRTMYSGGKLNTNKRSPSVSAQFQWSLSRLMQTLNQANPFFIRCIKSNAEKLPCKFDRVLVLQQLRYTGMLATVRIRQSGYNYRLLFQEFVQLYQILLPRGLSSDQSDISTFLQTMNMNQDNFQIGINKVFLRETEKLFLDECLHRAIMKRIVFLQRWVRTKVERKNFLQLRVNVITVQKFVRTFLVRRRLERIIDAVSLLQRWYRGVCVRRKYHLYRKSAIRIQANVKGHLQRKRYRRDKAEYERRQLEAQEALKEDVYSCTSDEGVLIKDGSADELETHPYHRGDSEESSGVHETESETDTMSGRRPSPVSPTTPGITIESLTGQKDMYLMHAKQHSSDSEKSQEERVAEMKKKLEEHEKSGHDDDSPTADKSASVSPLSPERIRLIGDGLKHPPNDDSSSRSPMKIIKHLVGGSRRSNEEVSDHETSSHQKAERMGGVSVFPLKAPLSPKSQQKQGSFDEEEVNRTVDRSRHKTRRQQDKEKEIEMQKGWSVAKRYQWQYPDEFIIQEVYELKLLDEFINRKIQGLHKDKKGESQFDVIFTKCLKSFQSELKVTISVQMQKDVEGQCNIKYRDLFVNFELIMNATCAEEKVDESFPSTMLLNAFRGFLDEFRNTVNSKKKDKNVRKKPNKNNKREKTKKDVIEYLGHKFSQMQFGMPTFCEHCNDLLWIMEKGHVCQICKYTCHRKCINKGSTPCKGVQESTQQISGTKVFCVPLKSLVHEDEKVPRFMDNLITLIETHGLFTEGIYRKPGSVQKVKMLKLALDSGLVEISIDEYPVHVLTNTLKAFFRDLPEPLLTFELYDEFIQAAEIHDEKEAVQVLYSLIERVPRVNHDVLERLIFHLARVASKESSNKMSVNALAIIFAPCLLRTNQKTQAQDMFVQMARQQQVVEKILQEQLRKMLATLRDINTLMSAEETAAERLKYVRASMRQITPSQPASSDENLVEQERVISSHIRSLQEERDNLTSTMPQLEYRHSSDDEMLSIEDVESTYDTADDMESLHEDQPHIAPTFTLHGGKKFRKHREVSSPI